MPAINFQPQFADYILSGQKGSTIRALRRDGRDPKPGQTLYLYTGQRSKQCRLLLTDTCKRVRPISIDSLRKVIYLDDHIVIGMELNCLFLNEGFNSLHELFAWFLKHRGRKFAGLLIEWKPIEQCIQDNATGSAGFSITLNVPAQRPPATDV